MVIDGRNEYFDILDEAWQSHLASRADHAPTMISAFAGCGGSSLGYSMAGFRELLAIEWDDNAVETFKLNFPDVPIYHGDIATLSIDRIFELTGLREGQLDVLDGSPPCQGFSTAGNRNLHDSRNQLFKEYVRLLRGLKPKVFVMENVSGMIKGKMKLIFAEIMREMKASGYKVSARLMNAMYFNVPQSRERMIFVGVREDLRIEPNHPKAQNAIWRLRNVLPSLRATRSQTINPWIDGDRSAATMLKEHQGYEGMPAFDDKYAQLWDRIPIPKGDRLTYSAHLVSGQGFNSCIKQNPDQPSCTLPKVQTGRGFATIAHPYEPRALTIEEAKIIGGYPDEFRLVGSYSAQWARIGNSVPPLFMRAIAKHIREQILSKID